MKIRLADHARFQADRMAKIALAATPRAQLDLYCLAPGQSQKVHSHDDQDKVYVVLEGRGRFTLGTEEHILQQGEALVRETGIPATILRPWYVLGPGHWWPYALVPVYAVLRALPATREGAERLALVTHRQMVASLVRAVATPPRLVRIVTANEIREYRR